MHFFVGMKVRDDMVMKLDTLDNREPIQEKLRKCNQQAG